MHPHYTHVCIAGLHNHKPWDVCSRDGKLECANLEASLTKITDLICSSYLSISQEQKYEKGNHNCVTTSAHMLMCAMGCTCIKDGAIAPLNIWPSVYTGYSTTTGGISHLYYTAQVVSYS